GRVMHERDLILLAADESGEGLAMRVHGFVAPARIRIGGFERSAFFEIVSDGSEYGSRRDPETAVVEEGSRARHVELLVAYALPVSFGIAGEERGVGERSRGR